MRRRWMGVLAGLLASTGAWGQGVPPTARDVAAVRASSHSYRSYPMPSIDAWERDLRAGLAHGSAARAADAIAAKYGFTQTEMRGLAYAWIIAQGRQYLPDDDRHWVPGVRADLLALVPSVRHLPLGLAITAETLAAVGDCAGSSCHQDMGDDERCSAANFDPLVRGSSDPAADAYVIANAAPCSDNFVRAALVAPERSIPALIRLADWGSLPPRDALPLYAWLTSPTALSRISAADRPALSVILWQRYLDALLKTGFDTRALALLDGMPAEMRARVLAAQDTPVRTAMVDEIAMSFQSEGGSASTSETLAKAADMLEDMADQPAAVAASKAGTSKPGTNDKPAQPAATAEPAKSTAPILKVALALAAANRGAEARALLETLPGLAAARAASACQYQRLAGCPGTNELPMQALPLDHLLNHESDDPYPIAETTLVNPSGDWTPAEAEIRCRVFAADQFPGVCADARKSAGIYAQLDPGDNAEEAATGDAALVRIVPGFSALRDGFVAEAAARQGGAAPAMHSRQRDTIAAVTPGFAEHPLPVADQNAAAAPLPKGLAKLPGGFGLVRAERTGRRAIAISVSQNYDPNGEVSRGGYWVHLSDDGGAHWEAPLYTGLAERFPYVVAEHSRLPLLSGDTLNLAVDVAELDTASITYPPVGLRTTRSQTGLYLEIPLAVLRRDSDGDGLTDVAARHLLIDHARTDGGTPFVVGSDRGGGCTRQSSPERDARIAVLARLFDPAGAAIVEPADRPAGEFMTGWQRATAAADQPLFLLGDPKDYACLRPNRPMIVYGEKDIEAIKRFTPDFHAIEIPPIIFNRAYDRGYVEWSSGWAGGTYRLRLIKGKWVFDTMSNWIT
ncbi:MAG: hypothetical protein ABI471_10345 [Sphingomonas bacterium]